MTSRSPKKLILNISNLQRLVLPLFLLVSFLSVNLLSINDASAGKFVPEVLISPEKPKQGDTVSVKVKKSPGAKKPPKVYFEASKQPVFYISDSWYRSFIPLAANKNPGEYKLDVVYEGGKKNIKLDVGETDYIIEELTLSKDVAGLMTTQVERSSVSKAIYTTSGTKHWEGKFQYPSPGKQSTPYGVKRKINGVLSDSYFHKGLDFAVSEGSSVKAPAKGKIVLAGHNKKGFVVNGNCVFIDHGHGVVSAYLHLSEILVKEGELVKKGQLIGKVGSTGIATGPHLHWGVYVSGQAVEPELWVKRIID